MIHYSFFCRFTHLLKAFISIMRILPIICDWGIPDLKHVYNATHVHVGSKQGHSF